MKRLVLVFMMCLIFTSIPALGDTVLLASWVNGNSSALNSRVYLFNPSNTAGTIVARIYTLPVSGPSNFIGIITLGTLGPRSGRNLKVAEAILQPAGILVPYITDGGNLAIEFTIIGADNVRGATQVFTSDISFAFGTYPLEVIPTAGSVPPDGGGGQTSKELALERMLGFWAFQYTIIIQFEDTFVNFEVVPSTAFEFVAVGVDEFFDPVLTIYDDVTQVFTLFDNGITISQVFAFTFNADGTVSGCYFLGDVDFENLGDCRPMTGEKADFSTVLLSLQLSDSSLTQTEIESMKLAQERSVNSTNTAGLLQSKDLNLERVIKRFRSSEIGKKLLAQ